MTRATRVVCPHCGTGLKSDRGVRVGKAITCPRCAAAFTVPADGCQPAAPGTGTGEEGVNMNRLSVVVVGAMFSLAGAGLLAFHCYTLNAHHSEPPPVPPATQVKEGDAEPPTPAQPVQRPTVIVVP